MASTTALFTGLSGLSANARRLEVIGNNISNVNTTAFKSNRMLFAPTLNRSFSLGTSPSGSSGGTNPGQIGLGVQIAGTQRDFRNGAISPTGINTDLAIEGEGFFMVERSSERFFTRAGAFQFNSQNDLVTISGDRLQGFAIDDQFNIVEGKLVALNIPMGSLTLAEATRNVHLTGNLNADADLATQGSLTRLTALEIGAVPAVAATLLTGLDAPFAFGVGDTITIDGAERGAAAVPATTFSVGAASTVGDFMQFLKETLGIATDGGAAPAEPGSVALDPATGEIIITGNFGELNDISIESGDISVVSGTVGSNPFTTMKTQDADGEAVRTSFVVYDSLGTELEVELTMVLARRDGTGTGWRAFLHSDDDTDLALHLEQGDRALGPFTETVAMVDFDTFGQIVPAPALGIEMDRTATGSRDPLQITLQFSSGGDGVSSLSDTSGNSTLAATFQDGAPLGILSSFSVGDDGIITGGFTNGLTRSIGQVALANFVNPEGLVDAGNNLFRVGPNSGTPLVTTPLEFGTGRVIGGALELSNVDLSNEFINMILTSTGYSAASRVINTSDQLLQQLLQIAG